MKKYLLLLLLTPLVLAFQDGSDPFDASTSATNLVFSIDDISVEFVSIDEEVTLTGLIQGNDVYSDLPVTWKVTYASGERETITPTIFYELDGDLVVTTIFTPLVSGLIIIELEIGPDYLDGDNDNNRALRVLSVIDPCPSLMYLSESEFEVGEEPNLLEVLLSDNNGEPMAEQELEFLLIDEEGNPVEGFPMTVQTNEDGIAQLSVLLPIGEYTLSTFFSTEECPDGVILEQQIEITEAKAREPFVTGGGWYTFEGDKASFSLNAKMHGDTPQGNVIFSINKAKFRFKSKSITSLEIDGDTAIIMGTGTIQKESGTYDFMVKVVDNGEPGTSDTIRIIINQGSDITHLSSNTLEGGNIQMHD